MINFFFKKIKNYRFSIGTSILLGTLLVRSNSNSIAIPLFDWQTEFFQTILLPLLHVTFIFLVILGNRLLKYSLSLALLTSVIIFIFKYSLIRAFLPVSALVCLHFLITNNYSRSEKIRAAQYSLFAIFFISAIQKINPAYLEGQEFVASSTVFFKQFYEIFPNLAEMSKTANWTIFSYSCIMTELLLAIFILIRPQMAVLTTTIFLLALCLFNSHVNYVLFLLMPLLLDLNPRLKYILHKHRFSWLFMSPFFWCSLLLIWNQINYSNLSYSLKFFSLIIFLMILSGYFIIKNFNIFKFHLIRDNFSLKAFMPVIFFVLYYLGNLFVLPSPAGFSMFSSQSFRHGWFEAYIKSEQGCFWLNNKVKILYVSDTRIHLIDNQSCLIKVATIGGIHYTLRNICNLDSLATLSYSTSPNPQVKFSLNCTSNYSSL